MADNFKVAIVVVGDGANKSIARIALPEDGTRILSVGRQEISGVDRQAFIAQKNTGSPNYRARISATHAAELFDDDLKAAELVIVVSTLGRALCRAVTPRLVEFCRRRGIYVVTVINWPFDIDASRDPRETISNYLDSTELAHGSLLLRHRDLSKAQRARHEGASDEPGTIDGTVQRTIWCLHSVVEKPGGLRILERANEFKYANMRWDENLKLVQLVNTIERLPKVAPTDIEATSSVVGSLRYATPGQHGKIRQLRSMLETTLPETAQLFLETSESDSLRSGFELTLLALFSRNRSSDGPVAVRLPGSPCGPATGRRKALAVGNWT